MSDTPQGEGWWQASDLKWYPPQDAGGSGVGGSSGGAGGSSGGSSDGGSGSAGSPDGGSGGERSRRRWVLPVVLVVVVGLVAAGVTFVVAGGGDEAAAESVVLEPVADVGVDPFTDSVSVNEVTEFPETVSAVIDDTVGELSSDDVTGTLVASGGTPGLYGGTRDDSACDVAALAGFLTDPTNEAKAKAWAGAAGVAVEDIEGFVSELAPSVLTLDTRVTNHGFRDGRATPRQSVLQAGSAVLVDALGVPRVRCSCGNPLAEPEALDLGSVTVTGARWASFEPGRTVVAQPAGEPQESLTLVDVTTADTYQAPVGQNITWVATAGGDSSQPGGSPGQGIWTSSDGTEWQQTLDSSRPLHGIAYGDGLFAAVGGDGESGVIYTSPDGATWSEVIAVDEPLDDIAYGNGRWLAIGAERSWSSTDANTWTEQPPFEFEYEQTYAEAIAFGDDRFLLYVSSCGASRCFPLELRTSTDGQSWTVDPSSGDGIPDSGFTVSLGFAGSFGITGVDPDPLPDGVPMVEQTYSPAAGRLEGNTWRPVSLQPADLDILGLGGAGSTWLAIGSQGSSSGPVGVWTSADMATWTQVGSVDATLTDIAASDEPVGSPPVPEEPNEPAPTGEIDFSSPLLNAYQETERMARSGDGPARLERDVAALTEATGIEWTEEMVIALATSACNDWESADEHELTPQGRSDWAQAIVPVLGIPLEAARIATSGDPARQTWAPCG